MLFKSIIFGPIHSRRLGISLGVNLLPATEKICSFNCVYCECGLNTPHQRNSHRPTYDEVKMELESVLQQMASEKKTIDTITFAGNGEPTLHPEFDRIIDATIALRDKYFPQTKISVLSNATMLANTKVFEALKRVDNNILKLDSALNETAKLINQPENRNFDIAKIIDQLQTFNGKLIVQTLFLRGKIGEKSFDNTTEKEVEAWLAALKKICPQQVELYSLDRVPPISSLQKIDLETLQKIAQKVRLLGIATSVVG